ncbi:BRO-like protein [Desulfovibrio sulfodismutans]|uniref:BRO-like protein n=1 Tax=Desulfolutivibrio sulfodismutans TaxID=63561 RepID=A0A7K3NKE2_9BACT|nr:BRO-like protein [Desulfolutivibrio sulfodismutans]QLA11228.1 BRO-like protein [Desulfolutivibrio sulfodismutans DSM 3696]
MNAVQPFYFDGHEVRTIQDEQGEPWFLVKDVCAVLELGNVTEATRRLDEDERGSVVLNTLGGPQSMATVSESGLYSLIFTSRKPEARAFRKWVTGTVLPAIRKTGRFEARPEAAREIPPHVRTIPPSLRAQIMHSATQAARMFSGGSGDVYEHFHRLCDLICAGPAQFNSTTASYEGVFNEWADRSLVRDQFARVQCKDLYASFVEWCESQGHIAPSLRRFGAWMRDNYARYDSRVIYYCGIRLASSLPQ